MPLQVRVRHALGERLMDLPDRTVESPVVVGRASGCEVQVPSVSVANKHCALFRHEGHWVVQDVGGTTGTFVNGEAVADPVFLQIGDVVSIGSESSAPTIEVDPAAAAEGRTGWAGEEASAAQAPAATAYEGAYGYAAPGAPAGPSYGGYAAQPRGYAAPGAPPAAGGYAGAGSSQPSQSAGFDPSAWPSASTTQGAAAGVTTIPYRRPAKSGMPPWVIIAGVVVVIGIFWAGIKAYEKYKEDKWNAEHPVVVEVTPKSTKTTKPKKVEMFEGLSGGGDPGTATSGGSGGSGHSGAAPRPVSAGKTPAAAPRRPGGPEVDPSTETPNETPNTPPQPAAPATGQPKATPAAPTPGATDTPKPEAGTSDPAPTPAPKPESGDKPEMDPATPPKSVIPPGGDAAWIEIEQVNANPVNPALAVYRMMDYKQTNPGKHEAEINDWTEKKLDMVWWERVDQLFKKRDRLTAAIPKKQQEIYDLTDPAEKKKELAAKTEMERDLKITTKVLREEMAYEQDSPPNLNDSAQLAQLAASRDAAKYAAWKRSTLSDIKSLRGKLRWDADQ